MAYTFDYDDFGGSCDPGKEWPVLSAIRDELSGELPTVLGWFLMDKLFLLTVIQVCGLGNLKDTLPRNFITLGFNQFCVSKAEYL